jgi:hypothetical protein
MFIAALFTIAKIWKQLRCPTTDGWIMKLWYIYLYIYIYVHTHTMENYSVTWNNDKSFEGKWMQLEDFMLCEVSQDQKHKRRMFSLIGAR